MNNWEDKSKQLFENLGLLSYKMAAQYLGISEAHLRRLKSQGLVPWVPMGKRGVRFNPKSLSKWVQDREIK